MPQHTPAERRKNKARKVITKGAAGREKARKASKGRVDRGLSRKPLTGGGRKKGSSR